MKALSGTLLALLLASGCSSSDTDSSAPPADGGTGSPEGAASTEAETSKLGGCILTTPIGDVPDDLYMESDVTATDAYPPFDKSLSVYGITLIARNEATDDFMRLVATAIKEVFPRDESLDLETQAEILRNLYRYNTTIPVPVGRDMEFVEENEAAWDQTTNHNTVCDIIMEGVNGQVMEVVEHILHFVSDVGLHYTFPDDWGISQTSTLAQAMDRAVELGYYDVGGYDDIDEPEVRHRVEIQEFAYWVISTAWNLQEAYGPQNEEEWTISDSADLEAKMPELYAMYERTVGRAMRAPSAATLAAIGPTRAEEGE